MATGDKILISGFGDTEINGVYTYSKEFNGYPLYAKTEDIYVCFASSWMPYSDIPSYYIVRVFEYDNSIPIVKPEYRKNGYSPTDISSSWVSLLDQRSEENNIGTVEVFLETSSSSSSSELYSSSNSSELYSSSSSSELYSSSSSSSELYSSSSSSELYSSSSSEQYSSSSSSYVPLTKPVDESFDPPAPSPLPDGWSKIEVRSGQVLSGSLKLNIPAASGQSWVQSGSTTTSTLSVVPSGGTIAWFSAKFTLDNIDSPGYGDSQVYLVLSTTKNYTSGQFITQQNNCVYITKQCRTTFAHPFTFGQRAGGVTVHSSNSSSIALPNGTQVALNLGVDSSGNCYISAWYNSGGGWVDYWTTGPIGLTWPLPSTDIYPIFLWENGYPAIYNVYSHLNQVRIIDTVLSPPPLP